MKYNLDSIIDSTIDSVMLSNKRGEILIWNKASIKMFGYDEKEALGSDLSIIIPASCKQAHREVMKRYLSSGEKNVIGRTVELIGRHKNGREFPIELSLSSREEEGAVLMYFIIRDLTEIKSQETDILDLESIIDSSPSCLKIIDINGRLIAMNKVGLGLIEADNFESVDRANVYDIVHEDDRSSFIEFNKFICGGGEGTLIFKIIGLLGTVRVMESFARSHIHSKAGACHLAITNDISARIQAEKLILEKEQSLSEVNKKLLLEIELRKSTQLKLYRSELSERKRIAFELHDGLGQKLTAAKFALGSIRAANVLSKPLMGVLSDSIDIIKNAMQEVRDISQNIAPSVLADYGLSAAVSKICDSMDDYQQIDIEYIQAGVEYKLSIEAEICAYRIVQEALNNACKYSNADKIKVQISFKSREVMVIVSDNGIGFYPEEVKHQGGSGILNMEERAGAVDFFFDLHSIPRKGTEITFKCPRGLVKRTY